MGYLRVNELELCYDLSVCCCSEVVMLCVGYGSERRHRMALYLISHLQVITTGAGESIVLIISTYMNSELLWSVVLVG